VVLRLTDAIADGDCIHAVIKVQQSTMTVLGKLATHSAEREWSNRSDRRSAVRCWVEPETVNYIEAHGTAALGDPIEITASQSFRASTEKRASVRSVQSKQISVI